MRSASLLHARAKTLPMGACKRGGPEALGKGRLEGGQCIYNDKGEAVGAGRRKPRQEDRLRRVGMELHEALGSDDGRGAALSRLDRGHKGRCSVDHALHDRRARLRLVSAEAKAHRLNLRRQW